MALLELLNVIKGSSTSDFNESLSIKVDGITYTIGDIITTTPNNAPILHSNRVCYYKSKFTKLERQKYSCNVYDDFRLCNIIPNIKTIVVDNKPIIYIDDNNKKRILVKSFYVEFKNNTINKDSKFTLHFDM